jgi:hypothetical protein
MCGGETAMKIRLIGRNIWRRGIEVLKGMRVRLLSGMELTGERERKRGQVRAGGELNSNRRDILVLILVM